jgi:outer membrane protein assembly factor BamA
VSRRWLVGFVFVFAFFAACGDPPRVRAPRPGADYLHAIRIEGNAAIATGALEPALALRETVRDGAAVDPFLLDEDIKRIRAAYVRRGFFAATVSARVDHAAAVAGQAAGAGQVAGAGQAAGPGRAGRAQTVVFTVVEGRRAAARVEIAGLPPELPVAEARALVALRDGAPFDYTAYDAAKQSLAARIQDAGYARADVRAEVIADPAAGLATARYEIVAGERCRFGVIRITGSTRPTLVAAVRARLRFATGDRYSRTALAASEAEIYELGRFSAVQVVADAGGAGAVIDVAVELSEANRHQLHGGFGGGYEPKLYEGRLRGGYSHVFESQPLMTAAVDARGALTAPRDRDDPDLLSDLQPKARLLGSFQWLDMLWPRLRGEAELGLDYQTVEAYTWTGGHARLGVAAPLGRPWLQLRVGWKLERLDLDADSTIDAEAAERLGLNDALNLGESQASLLVDLRDDPVEPHSGGYIDLRAAVGTPLAGGALRYLQLTPELRGYFSLGRVVIALRARAGAIVGDVPVIARYYSGGSSGHRGFSHRRLSPSVADCAGVGASSLVIGGAGLVEAGIELRRQLARLPYLGPFGMSLFLDVGDVRCAWDELDPANLSWAAGTTVWAKPVGNFKIGVNLGYLLPGVGREPEGGGLDNFVPLLAIGEAY